ncbi:MAG: hypothetical protein ACI4EA_03705 [Candidatus Ornithomonoglobus sp.]
MLYKVSVNPADSVKVTVKGLLATGLSELPIASLDTLGGVKLYGKSVNGVLTNKSGLSILNDGSMLVLVKANGGLAIDGVGQLYITGADEAEVFAGTQQYKPITPAQFSRFITYSTIPQRVGTWIDGKPIWRKAISITLTADDFTNGYYQLTAADLNVVIRDEISRLLNCSIRCCSASNGFEDSVPVNVGDYCTIDLSGVPTGYNILAGYIEFVTSESNIITT